MSSHSALFPALLKYWRNRRGLSQLDLALAAEVSARHISFLETARAQPSADMVRRLATTLRLTLRDQNALLRAAGHAPAFAEPAMNEQLEPVRGAIARMLVQQEPYPMLVMNRRYDIVAANDAAHRVFTRLTLEPSRVSAPPNVFHGLFDPKLSRSFVMNWAETAHQLLARLHLEALERAHDDELSGLVRQLFEYPDVPQSWRQPDLSSPPGGATFSVRFRRDELELGFLTTITVFAAPGNVTLDELRLESYFPLDEATVRACQRLRDEA